MLCVVRVVRVCVWKCVCVCVCVVVWCCGTALSLSSLSSFFFSFGLLCDPMVRNRQTRQQIQGMGGPAPPHASLHREEPS